MRVTAKEQPSAAACLEHGTPETPRVHLRAKVLCTRHSEQLRWAIRLCATGSTRLRYWREQGMPLTDGEIANGRVSCARIISYASWFEVYVEPSDGVQMMHARSNLVCHTTEDLVVQGCCPPHMVRQATRAPRQHKPRHRLTRVCTHEREKCIMARASKTGMCLELRPTIFLPVKKTPLRRRADACVGLPP